MRRLVAEDRAQLGDRLDELRVLGPDLVRLERGQALQAHVEDRLGLLLRELELVDQAVARGVRVLEPRISAITASRLSSAISSPSRMWARASAWRSWCWVRRVMTSRWWTT